MTVVPGSMGRFVPLLIRLALATAFLSAVADRLGLWGPAGAQGVAWGNFDAFVTYTARVNPWAPAALVPPLAWLATAAEGILSVLLIVGWRTRLAGLLSGVLLLAFGIGMTAGMGIKSPLDASVFTAASAAFGLALLGAGPASLDGLRHSPGA